VPVTALDRTHGGSLIGCLLCDEGSYEHGGTMIWMNSNGEFKELNTTCFGVFRRLPRLMTYVCCCIMDNAVSDHLGTPYVQNYAKCCKKAGVQTHFRCQDPPNSP